MANVEQWGEKLGYTEDHAHYHRPDLHRGVGGAGAGGKKRRSSVKPMDHDAAIKIQSKMRSNLAKKQTFQKREQRDKERRHEAATKIQSRMRGNIAKKKTFEKRQQHARRR